MDPEVEEEWEVSDFWLDLFFKLFSAMFVKSSKGTNFDNDRPPILLNSVFNY